MIMHLFLRQHSLNWVVPMSDRGRYDDIFLKTDTDLDGFVSGQEVKEIFIHSGLSQNILAHIWCVHAALALAALRRLSAQACTRLNGLLCTALLQGSGRHQADGEAEQGTVCPGHASHPAEGDEGCGPSTSSDCRHDPSDGTRHSHHSRSFPLPVPA